MQSQNFRLAIFRRKKYLIENIFFIATQTQHSIDFEIEAKKNDLEESEKSL